VSQLAQISTILGGAVAAIFLGRMVLKALHWGRAVLEALLNVAAEMAKVSKIVTNHEGRITALERRRGA